MQIPVALRELAARGPAQAEWLAGLPRLVNDVLTEWQLTPDGESSSGSASLVVPVITADGRRAAAKFGWPHPESRHEHLALRAWAGNGSVELWRADPHRSVLLLERAGLADLTSIPVLEACEVVALLYRRLHRRALPQLQRLSDLCADWAARLVRVEHHPLVPRRLVTQARSLTADFASEASVDDALIHTDLHFTNVLAAKREPWLVIDPKPLAGDPCFEVAPLLWNRWDEIVAAEQARAAILARFFTVVDAADLEEDRARAWVVVRGMVNVMWALEDHARGAPLDRDWITVATIMVKAMTP
jgi:streptomycin 6-kinase